MTEEAILQTTEEEGQRGGSEASEECRKTETPQSRWIWQKFRSLDEYGPRMYSVLCKLVGSMYLEIKVIFLKLGLFHFWNAINSKLFVIHSKLCCLIKNICAKQVIVVGTSLKNEDNSQWRMNKIFLFFFSFPSHVLWNANLQNNGLIIVVILCYYGSNVLFMLSKFNYRVPVPEIIGPNNIHALNSNFCATFKVSLLQQLCDIH